MKVSKKCEVEDEAKETRTRKRDYGKVSTTTTVQKSNGAKCHKKDTGAGETDSESESDRKRKGVQSSKANQETQRVHLSQAEKRLKSIFCLDDSDTGSESELNDDATNALSNLQSVKDKIGNQHVETAKLNDPSAPTQNHNLKFSDGKK